jgi:zinc D-Ala-D-Ala dipeptidase
MVWSCTQKTTKEDMPPTAVLELPDSLSASKTKSEITPSPKQPAIAKQPRIIDNATIKTAPNTPCPYDSSMIAQGLVDVQKQDTSIRVELKYSTADNFMAKDVYGCLSICYLQKEVALKLKNASKILQENKPNLRLLVYDGARPKAIQQLLWDALPQYNTKQRENYVANPAKGSIHNYGSAVDLTLVSTNGQVLDMGTKYDFFGPMAYPKFEQKLLKDGQLSHIQIANRLLLRQTMQAAGFMPIEYEWWHFNALSRAAAKAKYRIVE